MMLVEDGHESKARKSLGNPYLFSIKVQSEDKVTAGAVPYIARHNLIHIVNDGESVYHRSMYFPW